ncbi:hypothetical protein NPIL_342051 [Nephila pilipes]|uniref:Uncharacterized protein n=1 Tax=Nephila pilipes TaxID=299642 RepID=A0A8X6MJW8_NEPPI|nr:hypothetical protein NPIL_342051 [Nephila pilipes]
MNSVDHQSPGSSICIVGHYDKLSAPLLSFITRSVLRKWIANVRVVNQNGNPIDRCSSSGFYRIWKETSPVHGHPTAQKSHRNVLMRSLNEMTFEWGC